jgi:outer membrane immunogenic protein
MKSKLIQSGIALAALIAAPFAAQAADLSPSPAYKAPSYVAPVFSWSGFYAGVNAGYGWGTSKWTPGPTLSPKGFLGGLTLGYNVQTGIWVWGLEGDYDYSAIKGSHACAGGTCKLEDKWFGTARGRIGYAGWNNVMPYLTGGAAFANTKVTSPAGNKTEWEIGWTFGGGVEYALWSNWSVKAEYLYADLGKMNCGVSCGAPTTHVTDKLNIVRTGLNYRF